MLGDLKRNGFQIVSSSDEPDVTIINTCAFVEDAKTESLEAIMEASAPQKDGKRRKVVVTGCLAQRYNKQLAEDLPEADLVVGFENYDALPAYLQDLVADSGADGRADTTPTTAGAGAAPAAAGPAAGSTGSSSSRSSANTSNTSPGTTISTAGSTSTSASAVVTGTPPVASASSSHVSTTTTTRSKGRGKSRGSGRGSGSSSSTGGASSSSGGSSRVHVGTATVPFRSESNRHRLTPPHSAYLRVAEGCNHACTFCAIPGFRGKFRSKPWQALLDEARALVDGGARELNLIAEDTNQYGMDRRDGRGLAAVMRELSKLEGLHWMRILYAYPSYFNDELIDEIANNPKVCKYIDIPLQHVNNLVLLAMARPPREHTLQLLTRLRDRIPGLALRTTFISGFPGESEEQHRELVKFCKEFKFERMGAFAFSEEDGTPAATLPNQVPRRVRQRRVDELTALQQRIGEHFAASLVGREMDVLVDGYDEELGCLVGRTQYDAPDIDPLVFLTDPPDEHQQQHNQRQQRSDGAVQSQQRHSQPEGSPGGVAGMAAISAATRDGHGSPAPAPGITSPVPPLRVGEVRRCRISGHSLFDLEAYPIA